jgi:eukaryotic-like serine/threonine-protein kinase
MSDSTVGRDPIEVLADSFLARFRRGERPSIEEYAAQHPELAEEIRSLLPALVMLEQEKSIAGPATGLNGGAVSAGPAPRQLGDYLILREIGRGGMGVVYEAVQQSLGRHVALKVLPHQALAGSSQLERFRLEARAAARLHHTNIVPVFGVGECEGVHYYAMQFIRGQGLESVIDALRGLRSGPRPDVFIRDDESGATGGNGRPLTAVLTQALLTGRFAAPQREPWPTTGPSHATTAEDGAPAASSPQDPPTRPPNGSPRALASGSSELSSTEAGPPFYRSVARVGAQVAEALAHAHGQGILHRDIKPSNLLLDAQGTVWVTDFGLAKAEEGEALTNTGDIVGTLRYMAPERFDGWSDPRSDVYALGATLYELLTVRPPFGESDRVKLIEQVLHENPPPPRKLDRRIPRDLETIVLKALSKWPGNRYATAERMAEDLRRFADDRPILARRTSLMERAVRWARRNKAITGLLVALAVVLSGGFALMTVLWARAEESARIARTSARDQAEARAQAQQQAKLAQEQTRIATARAEELALQDYISRVNRAYHEIEGDNAALAEDLLHGCPPERRGWEWHFVHRLCNLERLSLEGGRQRSLNAITFSPDGRWVAAGTGKPKQATAQTEADRAEVVAWDAATGRRRPPLGELKGTIFCLAISPDGTRVAVGSGFVQPRSEGRLTLWDVRSGNMIWEKCDPQLMTRRVAFGPDGRSLAVGFGLDRAGAIGQVRLYETATGRETPGFTGPPGGVNTVAFDHAGKRLAVASSDFVEVWDLSVRAKPRVLKGHTQRVQGAAFSSDGKWLATGGGDGTIMLWDAATGERYETIFGHRGAVSDLSFSPDGRLLASSSEDRSVKLWEVPTGRLVGTFHGHSDFAHAVAFRPDGRELASGGSDGTLKLWDLRTSLPIVLDGHTGGVVRVAFRDDGRRIMTEAGFYRAEGQMTKGWDPVTGEPDPALTGRAIDAAPGFSPPRFGGNLSSSPDGRLTAEIMRPWTRVLGSRSQVYEGNVMELRDAKTDRVAATLSGHTAEVNTWDFSPDGRRLATASSDRTVKIWDTASGLEVLTLRGHTSDVMCVAFSPDGRRLASGGSDRTARIWDATPLPAGTLAAHEALFQQKLAAFEQLRHVEDPVRDGERLVRLGRWPQAAAAYAKAVEQNSESTFLQYAYFLSLLAAGDQDGYRRVGEGALARYGTTTDSRLANELARCAALAPDLVADHDAFLQLAKAAFQGSNDAGKSATSRTLGAALHRVGRFDEAIRRLDDGIRLGRGEGTPQDWAFLAMAHHRLGHRPEARRWFAKLRAWNPGTSPGLTWEGVEIGILRREAESVVSDAEPARP